MVQRALKIVHYFRPSRWFMENPKTGLLKTLKCMADIPYVDLDYSQFSTWGYQKPTRFWGGPHVMEVACVIARLARTWFGNPGRKHRERLGGNRMRFSAQEVPDSGRPDPIFVRLCRSVFGGQGGAQLGAHGLAGAH